MQEAEGWHLSLLREVSLREWNRESIPGSPCSRLRTEEIAPVLGSESSDFALRSAATFVPEARSPGRTQCARAGGAGRGRRRVPGTAPCRPGPLHPGTAELASCRGTTLPRPQRDPGARAGGNIVPAGGQLARVAAGRALGGCARLPAPGGHAPGGAGSPGTRRNLAAAGRVGRPLAFLPSRQPSFLSALQEGTRVSQCPGRRIRALPV